MTRREKSVRTAARTGSGVPRSGMELGKALGQRGNSGNSELAVWTCGLTSIRADAFCGDSYRLSNDETVAGELRLVGPSLLCPAVRTFFPDGKLFRGSRFELRQFLVCGIWCK